MPKNRNEEKEILKQKDESPDKEKPKEIPKIDEIESKLNLLVDNIK